MSYHHKTGGRFSCPIRFHKNKGQSEHESGLEEETRSHQDGRDPYGANGHAAHGEHVAGQNHEAEESHATLQGDVTAAGHGEHKAFIFFYGGSVFIKGAVAELQSRKPGSKGILRLVY